MIVISESKLREIISSVIREHLEERGTNLSSLYHFTSIKGLWGIIESGRFNLSNHQLDIRGGKNYMSFTRHKSPLEGYAVPNQSLVRIEVSADVLNSIHNKSVDSFEYYSPDKAKKIQRCNAWRNLDSSGDIRSAKAAYGKHKEYRVGYYGDEEFLNQAEECLTSYKNSIDAERTIDRIDICVAFPRNYCGSYIDELRINFRNILYANFSPLYDKIFIYDNMRDFALQTNNCVPISQYSMEKFDFALLYGNDVQKPVAESVDEEGIHIKEKNKGKFNATKERTGKSTEELTHSKNPLTRKRAIFAQNAKKWNKNE